MATSTTKLGLTKPDFVDVVDVSELNTNADAIDAAVGATIVTSGTRPASPWAGQIIYETDTESTFVWTGSAWIASGGGASVTVATTAPAGPDEGDLWLNSTEAKMYVYYDDGTSAQWVAAVGGTVPQQGKILQVVSTAKTDTFSTNATSLTAVTGLSASITPSFATSKIYVVVSCVVGFDHPISDRAFLSVFKDGTNLSNPTSPGSRAQVFAGVDSSIVTNGVVNQAFSVLDSPATTSALVYDVRIQVVNGSDTMYINRSSDDGDSGSRPRGVSSITLMEVAG